MSRQQRRALERKEAKMNKVHGIIPNHKMIVGDDKERANQCGDAVKMALDRYDCDLIPQIVLTPGNVSGAFIIKAKPRGEPN